MPVTACRYMKSACTHSASVVKIASRAGSCTMRSMFTISSMGSDMDAGLGGNRGGIGQGLVDRPEVNEGPGEQPVIADAHNQERGGNHGVEQDAAHRTRYTELAEKRERKSTRLTSSQRT